jgi:signal transduction histidine kinase/DNA-binding NarL/FixJ family response regulator
MIPPAAADYRDKVLYALALVATAVVLPFAVANLVKGYVLIGLLATLVVAVLDVNAFAIYRGRRPPLPLGIAFAVIVLGVVIAVWQRGLMSVFWTFPAILLFHFVLERRLANAFNLAMVAIVGAAVGSMVELDFALRVVAGQLLTIAFANIFSYAVEAEQKKEMEQRRRLNLLVRATQAGFFQWERQGDKSIYSGRLKEMLGYPAEADTSAWPPFSERIHPEERPSRLAIFRAGARARAEPGGVRRHLPSEYRLCAADGKTVWVHVEGLFLHGADGRVERYIAAIYDVTEMHRREDELRAAIGVREEVERIARHDLKTPLHSIVAVPRLLREARPLDAREEELLGMVEGAAYRMLDMVNLSIDLYHMERGDYRFSPRSVDLRELIETVWREVRAHADTKQLQLDIREEGSPVLAWGEPLLCYSVLANLLKNAVEASPDGGTVSALLGAQSDCVVLEVHNAGVVPASVRDRFFEKYVTHGKAGGAGLGAYSARLMSRVQQGELEMRTSEDGGTTLILTLRAAPRNVLTAGPSPQATPSRAGERALPPLRVLLVDDDAFNVMFMRGTLPSPPLAVDSAINGRAALEAARARHPDLVFMDLEMPVMDGFQALVELRRLEAQTGRKRCPVIAFSSFDDEATRRRCEEAGFDGYLTKPATRERIHELLHATVATSVVPTDPDLAALMPSFIASRERLLDEVEAALLAGDRAAAARTAHKLAGAFALYGFEAAAATSRRLHAEAAAASLADLQGHCAALRAALQAIRLPPGEADGRQEKAAARR